MKRVRRLKNRYVITSSGQISAIGNNVNEILSHVLVNNNNYCLYDNSSEQFIAATVKNFDFYQYGFNIKTYLDRASQLCTYAVRQVRDSMKSESIENERMGLITASSFGCHDSAAKYLNQIRKYRKAKLTSPVHFVHSICNIPNSIATIECKIKGICNHLTGYSEAGLLTLWQAIHILETNQSDYMIAGAFDVLSNELVSHLKKCRLICTHTDFDAIKGPFDKNRKYAVWGEASAFLGIERMENAELYGRRQLGEIKGIGIATSVRNKTKAIEQSIKTAIDRSNLYPENIDFVISNANGTLAADNNEAKAIKNILGTKVPVFAPKSYFGDAFSVSGILGIVLILTLNGNVLPPNRNLYNLDETLGINVMYNNVSINDGSIFIATTYNRNGTAVSVCIEVGKGM